MSADPVLVLAWLALAHLVADFILQTKGMVEDKTHPGRRAWRGLIAHGAAVGLCLTPFAAAFGPRGVALLAIISLSHVAIDRWKVVATRHAEADALAEAHRRHADAGITSGLGPAWTPTPGILFIADQFAHGLVSFAAWLVLVAFIEPGADFTSAVDRALGPVDRASFHVATVVTVVIASLLIVNVRAAALFVATLVHPRQAVTGEREPDAALSETRPARWWRLRLGPLVATAEAATAGEGRVRPAESDATVGATHASPARIGATIGVLERLLIVTFVLTNATAAIGLVVGAKTLARFKQLDDRDFAEYYLLGTLASVAVALGSALLADAALATVGL
jgi:hypothetical protein